MLHSTITERIIVRDSPDGDGKKKEYGPYYQWTWKRAGKTVTVNLSASQAKVYQKAIEEHRKMEGLLDQLRAASLNCWRQQRMVYQSAKERRAGGVTKRQKRLKLVPFVAVPSFALLLLVLRLNLCSETCKIKLSRLSYGECFLLVHVINNFSQIF